MRVCTNISIIGSGGHAKVVFATLRAAGYMQISVYDDDPSRWDVAVMEARVRCAASDILDAPSIHAIIAVGDNAKRASIAARLTRTTWISAVHPAACVHESVSLGVGSVIFAGAVVQPDTIIARHVIVNTSASVDHDSTIGEFSHIAPGARLTGGVRVGAGVLVGAGAVAAPGVHIGDGATVGAGAVVLRDVAAGVTVVGNPARRVDT